MMRMFEAFIIVTIESFEDGKILVRGRACENIKLGDLLFAFTNKTDKNYCLEFRVASIITYRREMEELYRMMTGDLILEGPYEENLKSVEMLYKHEIEIS